jgi:hypothetical protein
LLVREVFDCLLECGWLHNEARLTQELWLAKYIIALVSVLREGGLKTDNRIPSPMTRSATSETAPIKVMKSAFQSLRTQLAVFDGGASGVSVSRLTI